MSVVKKFLSLKNLMGHVRKDNMKSYWSTDPHNMQGISGGTMGRDSTEAFGKFGI
jgi:hypothetical protein